MNTYKSRAICVHFKALSQGFLNETSELHYQMSDCIFFREKKEQIVLPTHINFFFLVSCDEKICISKPLVKSK